jgi:hypothetical protein
MNCRYGCRNRRRVALSRVENPSAEGQLFPLVDVNNFYGSCEQVSILTTR